MCLTKKNFVFVKNYFYIRFTRAVKNIKSQIQYGGWEAGDKHPPLPARHGTRVEEHRLWRWELGSSGHG